MTSSSGAFSTVRSWTGSVASARETAAFTAVLRDLEDGARGVDGHHPAHGVERGAIHRAVEPEHQPLLGADPAHQLVERAVVAEDAPCR